jgi:hypothetical protein
LSIRTNHTDPSQKVPMSLIPKSAGGLLSSVLLASMLLLAPAPPASAAAPVTTDDQVSMYAGESRMIRVLRNDSDPDGPDDLGVCRLAPAPDDASYSASVHEDRVQVYVHSSAVEDITLTYYACDYETLVPGTITIDVTPVKPVRVVKTGRLGQVRVTNTNDRTIRFYWGNFFIETIDGQVRVGPGEVRLIHTDRTRIHWAATFGYRVDVDSGTVARIPQPPRGR